MIDPIAVGTAECAARIKAAKNELETAEKQIETLQVTCSGLRTELALLQGKLIAYQEMKGKL